MEFHTGIHLHFGKPILNPHINERLHKNAPKISIFWEGLLPNATVEGSDSFLEHPEQSLGPCRAFPMLILNVKDKSVPDEFVLDFLLMLSML